MSVANTVKSATEYWRDLWSACDKQNISDEPIVDINCKILSPPPKLELASPVIPISAIVKANNDNTIQVQADFDFLMEERASILEYETCIPYAWSLAIVNLRVKKRPIMISIEKWRTIKKVMQQLCDQEYLLLNNIIAQGWAISDIFGCDKSIPEKSFYNMGLIMLLNEQDKIVNVDSSIISIENSKNVISSYKRLYANTRINQVLIHELI